MRLINFFILFIFFIFTANNIFAGISVSPGAIEAVAAKGEEVVQNFKIVNPGNSLARVNVNIINFSEKDQTPSAWLTVEPLELELKPGETKEISCKVKPPIDAEGELRTRVCISSEEIGESMTPIGVRFNIPIYIAIQNTVKFGVEIEKVDIRYNSENKEIEGEIYINNKSNVHIRPEIKLTVKDLKDNLAGRINVPYGQPAQKEETRMFIFKEKMDLHPDRYKIVADVDYGSFYGLKDFVVTKERKFKIKP